jgi:hypothetical protein
MAHFEIGHDKGTETESVFRADTLQECLTEWKQKGYNKPEYFIDIWEEVNGVPYPIADINIEDWIFKPKNLISSKGD